MFELALSFLSNPQKLWASGQYHLRRIVLRLAFSDRVTYCRQNGFSKVKTALPFNILRGICSTKLELARLRDFEPVKVREALDGFAEKKRFAMYEMFSELAGHPTMKSAFLMRPQRDGDAVIGPFVEPTILDAVVSEMGRLAIQVGEQLNLFFPADWPQGLPSRLVFAKLKQRWIAAFYPSSSRATPTTDKPDGG
jgi:hypothetical protein